MVFFIFRQRFACKQRVKCSLASTPITCSPIFIGGVLPNSFLRNTPLSTKITGYLQWHMDQRGGYGAVGPAARALDPLAGCF